MNIGERFYCSRCLKELKDEGVCAGCGYDPSAPPVPDALEEGTLLDGGRFQIGAVRQRCRMGFLYGAYDHAGQRPLYLFEFFPGQYCARAAPYATAVVVTKGHEVTFDQTREKLIQALRSFYNVFEENSTFYAIE